MRQSVPAAVEGIEAKGMVLEGEITEADGVDVPEGTAVSQIEAAVMQVIYPLLW